MTQFVSNNVSSGATIFASDHNEMGSRIAAVLNGGLDDNNISSLSGSKITAGTIPSTALDTNTAGGWIAGLAAPSSITYNGNRSYSLVFSGTDYTSTISPGMRLKTTRSVAAPTQCTSLNGSTQYYSKTSPVGMSFTVTCSALGWRKLNTYSAQWFGGRTTGTNGFRYGINASGQLIFEVQPGNATTKTVTSNQSVPLNKGFRFAFQIDLNGTCAIMLDGVDIASTTAGSATSLTQAGDWQLGAANGAGFTNGKMAQDAIFSAKLASTTVRSYEGQSYAGTETSLISAYSFNNSINDLNTINANNLTPSGSAVATNADSPFGGQASGLISSTLDYAEVRSVTFSTDTTVVVQTPSGNTIPTTGGVSAISYSTQAYPYNFPGGTSSLGSAILCSTFTSNATSATQILGMSVPVYIPTGSREIEITLNSRDVFRTGGGVTDITIWTGSAAGTLTTQIAGAEPNVSSGSAVPLAMIWKGLIPSGSIYINAALSSQATANSSLEATTVAPAQLSIKLLN